jgi:hypothetical protein
MTTSQPKAWSMPRLLVLAIVGIAALWFALMFALANDGWTVVRLPTPPWSPAPSTPAFEARLFAIMLAAAAVGALLASLAWRRTARDLARRLGAERARARGMESELAALGRLVSSERERKLGVQGPAGQTGDAP